VVAVTRLGFDGYGVRRAGSFSAKAGETHPVGIITRLSLDGYGARRAGTFSGKTPEATGPVIGVTGGDRISGGYFSRKRWHEIIGAHRAALRAAEVTRSKKKKAALEKAAQLAKRALDLAEHAEVSALKTDIENLALNLDAASSAVRVADSLKRAKFAQEIARELIAAIERFEDEEEAIALLLMN